MNGFKRWRIATLQTGVFRIDTTTEGAWRPATAREIEEALQQLELFGAADKRTEPTRGRGGRGSETDT